jgi:hypothetical protein
MREKCLLNAGALLLGLCLGTQPADASTGAGAADRHHGQPAARYKLAFGGVPGYMVEDLWRGRRWDPPEYYDSRSGRWRHGYAPRQHHRGGQVHRRPESGW